MKFDLFVQGLHVPEVFFWYFFDSNSNLGIKITSSVNDAVCSFAQNKSFSNIVQVILKLKVIEEGLINLQYTQLLLSDLK